MIDKMKRAGVRLINNVIKPYWNKIVERLPEDAIGRGVFYAFVVLFIMTLLSCLVL